MRVVSLSALSLLLLLAWPAAAAELVVRVAPDGPGLLAPRTPALAVDDDGYAVAWFDAEAASPRWRLARFDRDGNGLGETTFGGLPEARSRAALIALDDGWLLLGDTPATSSALRVEAQRLDAAGAPVGTPVVSADTRLLSTFDAAVNDGSIVLTTVEFEDVWTPYIRPLDASGVALEPRSRLGFKAIDPADPSTFVLDPLDAPVKASGGGFVSAWTEPAAGVRLRGTARNGRPRGDVVSLTDDADCPHEGVDLAVLDRGLQAVVYGAGCDQSDLALVTRKGRDVSARVWLTNTAWNEGLAVQSVRAVGGGARFAVLYSSRDGAPPFVGTVLLAEFTAGGTPLGLPRDLGDASSFDLVFDAASDRYVVTWVGPGPEGEGVYLAAFPAAD